MCYLRVEWRFSQNQFVLLPLAAVFSLLAVCLAICLGCVLVMVPKTVLGALGGVYLGVVGQGVVPLTVCLAVVLARVGRVALFLAPYVLCQMAICCALEALVTVGRVALPTCGGRSGALCLCASKSQYGCCALETVALSVVRQALVMAVFESSPLTLGSECVRLGAGVLAFYGSTVVVCPGQTTRMIWVRSSGVVGHCLARHGFSTLWAVEGSVVVFRLVVLVFLVGLVRAAPSRGGDHREVAVRLTLTSVATVLPVATVIQVTTSGCVAFLSCQVNRSRQDSAFGLLTGICRLSGWQAGQSDLSGCRGAPKGRILVVVGVAVALRLVMRCPTPSRSGSRMLKSLGRLLLSLSFPSPSLPPLRGGKSSSFLLRRWSLVEWPAARAELGASMRSEEVAALAFEGVAPVRCDLSGMQVAVTIRLVTARFPIAMWCLSRLPFPSRWDRDGLEGRDSIWSASSASVARLACRLVPHGRAVPCVPALAYGPSRVFRKGCQACLCLLGLSWLQVVTVTWDPRSPRVCVRGCCSGRRGLLESLTLVEVGENGGDSGIGFLVALAYTVVVDWPCLVSVGLAPDRWFCNLLHGAIRGGGTRVCSSLNSWRVQSPEWFRLWTLNLVESSFASALLEFLLLWLVRD
ncbi:hypothetical protein Taro_004008 [Colocasia esculenta]|uniref:Uncharacterized protein n=1 Tax=Colocasia esculenta TaxID=4460 RepID=A0A843TN95_COLES|nr:hypothetical protein [Colocasia esculenta]